MLALATLLLVPAVAAAALPPANPPDVAKLKAKGVQVDWPLTASVELTAYHVVALEVRSRTPVTVSLVVVGRNGRPLRSLARKTLRHGRVDHYMAGHQGRRLALRLDVGKQRYWSWIVVRRDTRPTLSCEHGPETAPTLQLGKGLRSGQRFTVGLRNAGRCPAGGTLGDTHWLRPTAAGWEPIPVDCAYNYVITPERPSSNAICELSTGWYDPSVSVTFTLIIG